jgi:hypothetical protein
VAIDAVEDPRRALAGGVAFAVKELRRAVHGAGPGPVDHAPLHDFLKDLDRAYTIHAGSLSVYLNQLRGRT